MSKPSQWELEISGFPHFIHLLSQMEAFILDSRDAPLSQMHSREREIVSPGPASLLLLSLCFVLVLDSFPPEAPPLSVQVLLSLVRPQCGLSVSSQCGSVSEGSHGGGDAVDQEGGEGKRTEVLSVVWSLIQSVSSMNHNLPGAHLLLC